MSKNEVSLTFKINDDGSLTLLTNKLKKSSKAIDEVSKSTNKLNKRLHP